MGILSGCRSFIFTFVVATTGLVTYFNFSLYQAADGQHMILHPLNMKCLLHHYGSHDMLPHRLDEIIFVSAVYKVPILPPKKQILKRTHAFNIVLI